MATKATIANIIAAMKASFPNFNPDTGTPEKPGMTPQMYMLGLGDLPDELVTAAAHSKMFESGRAFAPAPGEIRGEAFRLQAQAAGIPASWQAYEEVINKPTIGERDGEITMLPNGTFGYPRKPIEWSHPLVERVAYLMGWPRSFPSSEPGIDRAHFIKAYESEQGRYLSDAAQLPHVAEYVEYKRLELQSQPRLEQVGNLARRLGGGG
jgi:hypothetical protein